MTRTITADEYMTIASSAVVFDVRRADDYAASADTVPGACWKDPTQIDSWITDIPRDEQVVIYCVRGGGVSNSVVNRMHDEGIHARYIEGGIEALKAAGVELTQK